MHIVGGFYEEVCNYPTWHHYFGSGGRAVAALSSLVDNITFHTYIHEDIKPSSEYFAKVHNVTLTPQPSTEKIQFQYYHALSRPAIYSLSWPIQRQEQLHIRDANIVICYGMLEAPNPEIHADYVIFDPQSENNPTVLNTSHIKHLALVLNVEEGKKYTDTDSIDAVAKSFFETFPALDVLILKDGPFGAHVFHNSQHQHIDSYITDQIFKIGSGDTFVAYFGYFWACKQMDVFEAAQKASYATAHYCNSKVFTNDEIHINSESFRFPAIKIHKEAFDKKIYLAGPFFTMAQRWLVEEAKHQLEKFNADVFSPLHDVGFGRASTVTQADLQGIDEADIVYAVLTDYDPGTVFEIGYAISKNIPVVIYIENPVAMNMTLFEGTKCTIEQDFATSIYKTIWELYKNK